MRLPYLDALVEVAQAIEGARFKQARRRALGQSGETRQAEHLLEVGDGLLDACGGEV